LFLFVFSIIAILTWVRWNLNVIFIFIFPMAKDGEHSLCTYWPFVLLLRTVY
jgi:hypothetical protein